MNIFLLIIILILMLVPAVYLLWHSAKNKKKKETEFGSDHYRFRNLVNMVRQKIDDRIDEEPKIRKSDDMKRKVLRARLKNAVREACLGDFGDREFLKVFIREILQNDLNINEKTIS